MLSFSILTIVLINLIGLIWAYTRQSDKLTDLIYGMSFFIMTMFSFLNKGDYSFPKILLTVMISLWSLRLAIYLFLRINKIKKDARFDVMRKQFKRLARFWFLQTVTILIIALPVIIFLAKDGVSLGVISWIGASIFFIGFCIEAIADNQKFRFKNNLATKDTFISSGLWKYSRHPNYFGEILCWIGVFLYGMPFLAGWEWLAILSPLWIIFLLVKVSGIPLLEKSADKKYGGDESYERYKKETPVLVPFF